MELSEFVGDGELTGELIVDQVYAKIQHENLAYDHENGGQAKYLETPLYLSVDEYMSILAASLLTDGIRIGMAQCMEDLASKVEVFAPVEFGDLRRSGHPLVYDKGELVYDRPPHQHRLSEAELRAKARLIPMPPELIGWIWWHVMHRMHPPIWYQTRGYAP